MERATIGFKYPTTASYMINSSRIHTDELFDWVDDFTRVTGLTSFAALQVFAECCYFQDPNALLQRLISIEAEYNLQLEQSEHFDGEPDIDGEIFSEHYGNYQLTLDTLADEDVRKFSEHYEKVLIHHGFNKQFSVYFIEHFHPLSERLTTIAPPVNKRFLFQTQYSYSPFFTEPPEAPEYRWHGVLERLVHEPTTDPAGWIAVLKMLGFSGMEVNPDPSWEDYEPSFYLGPSGAEIKKYCEEQGIAYDDYDDDDFFDLFEATPVYLTPFRITAPNTFSWDMTELRAELASEAETVIVLYAAPYLLRAPDKINFVSIWGEIFDGDEWRIMPLHANSRSLDSLIDDAFVQGSEPNWQSIATSDQPLVELWQTHQGAPEISPSAIISEVFGFKPAPFEDG